MVNINEEFPSKYLKSADLKGTVQRVKIDRIEVEQIGTDRKLVMYFAGKDKGMVLNKTNARTIGDVYGEDTDAWLEAPIEVFSMKVDFQGRMVDGLRIRVPPPKRQSAVVPNARERTLASAGAMRAEDDPPPHVGGGDAFDDDVPFAAEWR